MKKTIFELLKEASVQINRLDAELIIAHVLNKAREFVVAHPEYKITKLQSYKFKKLINKKIADVPTAYLTGHKEFYGLNFLVNTHTLVPRPETELIVDFAIEEIQRAMKNEQRATLIDVGTGSGCIPIATLSTLQHFNTSTPITFATDISKPAIKIAKKNAKNHNVNIKFLHGNLLDPIFTNKFITHHSSFIILTANLPYLTEEQFKSESSIQHEPKSALIAEKKGLALYEQLFKQIKSLSKTYNLKPKTYIEIDPLQSNSITKLIQKHLPTAKIEIKKDLAGHNRIVEILI
ncbi:peptide chain release factor N(5)-glutamine methyltransferase [Patescibacteria group bacterium]|nr:peptide chain release factor N(5)-glutamine methyltransferase [Patescibacteria group bacterium]MBU1895604.1 peptide chain release factor N(5)-glutamine methyltransferase [Patescibacteria group bacterium]